MPEDEFDWSPGATWVVPDSGYPEWWVVDENASDAAVLCVVNVLRSIREPCENARKGFVAAAQFYALAAMP